METIKNLWKQIAAYWTGKDKGFQRAVIVAASVTLVAIVVATLLLTHTSYAVLYTDLDDADAGDVMTVLEEKGVDAKVEADTILVPAEEVDRLRMELASEGYPKNSFSLDILSQGQGLTSTESDKQDYRRYQIQYNLQNTIKQFSGVADAQVMLTIPEDSSLVIESNKQNATAAILLTLDGKDKLSDENVQAIINFVQKSVPGLTAENISIVDNNMNVLDVSEAGETDTSDHYALQQSVQDRLQQQVMALLMPIFGVGKVQSQVAVTLDFDAHTTDTVKFEPSVDGKDGIVKSIETLREDIVNGAASSDTAGTDSNTGTTTYPVVSTDNGTYAKNTEKISYEINSIKEHIEKEKGAIKNLSVAVAIDSTDATEDYTDTVTKLVANTVGVDSQYVTVQYIPMSGVASANEAAAEAQAAQQSAVLAQHIRDYVVIGVVAGLILAAMLLLFRALRPRPAVVLAEGPMGGMPEEGEEFLEELSEEEAAEAINLVKDSETRNQLGKFIETNPELAANLLRSWLSDEE